MNLILTLLAGMAGGLVSGIAVLAWADGQISKPDAEDDVEGWECCPIDRKGQKDEL